MYQSLWCLRYLLFYQRTPLSWQIVDILYPKPILYILLPLIIFNIPDIILFDSSNQSKHFICLLAYILFQPFGHVHSVYQPLDMALQLTHFLLNFPCQNQDWEITLSTTIDQQAYFKNTSLLILYFPRSAWALVLYYIMTT